MADDIERAKLLSALNAEPTWIAATSPLVIDELRALAELKQERDDAVAHNAELAARCRLLEAERDKAKQQGREEAAQAIERQRLAYAGPSGSWAQRWVPFVCKHAEIRCTHGDEIIARRWRRRVCMVCGRALKGPLPDWCFFAERPRHGG